MTSIGSTGGIGNFEERLTGPGLADQKRSAGGGVDRSSSSSTVTTRRARLVRGW
jgi:hypothetical protein